MKREYQTGYRLIYLRQGKVEFLLIFYRYLCDQSKDTGDKFVEPTVGIEPTTCSLRKSCSTTELRWHIIRTFIVLLYVLILVNRNK